MAHTQEQIRNSLNSVFPSNIGLIGAYAGANPDHILEASVIATASMGLSGQIARDQVEKMALGTSSLKIKIIDNISTLDWKNFEEGAKIESI